MARSTANFPPPCFFSFKRKKKKYAELVVWRRSESAPVVFFLSDVVDALESAPRILSITILCVRAHYLTVPLLNGCADMMTGTTFKVDTFGVQRLGGGSSDFVTSLDIYCIVCFRLVSLTLSTMEKDKIKSPSFFFHFIWLGSTFLVLFDV